MTVKGKVIPTSFLKIVGRGSLVEVKNKRLLELVGDQNPGPKTPPRGEREVGKGNVRGRAMEKIRYVWVIRRRRSEEMTQSNTSSPLGSEVPFEAKSVRWQLKSPKMKRYLEEERMQGKKKSVLLSVVEERIGKA